MVSIDNLKSSTILFFIFVILIFVAGCTPATPVVSPAEPQARVQNTVTPASTLMATPNNATRTPTLATVQERTATVTEPVPTETVQPTLPIIIREKIKAPFGVELHDFATMPMAVSFDNYWLRYNALLWSDYQPRNANQFIPDEELEANLIAANRAGMELILIIRSTPTWAQKYKGYYCGPMDEDHLDDFAAFMAQVVSKYSAEPYNVSYYELWNEPDEALERVYAPDAELGCWGDPEDPTFGGRYYGEMLKAVYPAVKAANPQAQIVLGGLVLPCLPGDDPYCDMSLFFEGVLQNGAGAYFDAISFHSYTAYNPSQPSTIQMEKNEHWWAASGGQVEGKLDYLKAVMAKYGIDKPILLTETALIDPNDQASADLEAFEQRKADYLVWLTTRNIAKGIEGTLWYHLDRYGWLKGGLLDRENQPLPAYEAYQVLASTLGGAVYQGDLSLRAGILGFEFSTDEHRIWVLFSEDGAPRYIHSPDALSQAYDLFGEPVKVSIDERIAFTRPIYILLNP